MALFQSSVLKDQLRLQDEQQLNKAYKNFTGFFHNPNIQENIRSSKEEQFQATFLNELFVKVLGYTMNPQPEYNLTTEFKNQKNARKADGAILSDGQAVGVIELKGTNTKHLEGIRQQAFDYKANHKGCVYVITSNFEKLRFYINDATEFVEFDLFELNREDFSLLWFCLHKENLLSGKPLRSKEASLVEEEVITKQFYKDYSIFKRELYRDLVKRNAKRLKNSGPSGYESDAQDEAQIEMASPEKSVKQNLFKKSQKLIDRFLFIFFAEDRALLPPNSIHKILSDWNKLKDLDAEMPLYDRFKLYFGYLDSGRKGTDKKAEIFAYNGGLFKPDPVLDMLEIDDELLYKHTSRLATYDFESQVDVNILGHIFENSLNEIESVNAEIEGGSFDKQKSKRKKDGVYYTPKYITKYIVENTVGRLCEEKKSELGFREEEYFRGRKRRQKDTLEALIKILEDYREWLLQLTICDPACGSGAFLNQALDFLIKEHEYIDEMKAKLLGGKLILSDIESTILERNIYGVDINEESVEIAKLSLWLRTAQPRRKLNDLSNSIKCGNSLIGDKKVAGNKAFKWEAEFPEVFAKGGFDVVIGNPPYVNIVNIEDKKLRKALQQKFSTFKNKCDLYSLFIEQSILLAKKEGELGFIFPNSWMGTSSFIKFRQFISLETQINTLVELPPGVFQDAVVTTVIMTTTKKESEDNHSISLLFPENRIFKYKRHSISLDKILSSTFFTYSFEPIVQLGNEEAKLAELVSFSLGIKTSDDKRFIFSYKKDESSFPMLRGKNIGRYFKNISGEYLWYKPELIKQKSGGRPRVLENFLRPKLLIQDISKSINATYDDSNALVNDTINVIYDSNESYSLLFILGLLNSKAVNSWFSSTFPEGLHIKINQLGEIPVPKSNAHQRQLIEKNADLLLTKQEALTSKVDKFLIFIKSQIKLVKASSKLQSWHELEFGEFIKELNKAIKASNKVRAKEAAVHSGEGGDATSVVEVPTLTKKDEFEWMELFEENKQKTLKLQREIEKTDKEIDAMIYELYGLTEEEIEVVESSIN
ncbi:Eco57I restriction-modification methylase domain-containing protein [Salinimicrobium sp. CAU 1759]